MNVNLADLYQAANLPINVDDFNLRQAAFTTASEKVSEKQLIDCCRMYFGWWEKVEEFEWFLAAFRNDPRFSFAGNKREASLLAGGLLLAQLKSGHPFAGLVVVCASAQGKRTPNVPGIDISIFETELKNLSVEPARTHWYETNFKPLGKTSVTAAKIAEDNSVATIGTVVMTGFTESHNATKVALSETQAIIKKMAIDLATAREQVAMMWWLIGGWSRGLKRSFAEIGAPLAYVSSGFDLADLSDSMEGPYAFEALLSRVALPVKKPKKPVSLGEIGDSTSEEDFRSLEVSKDADTYPDICLLSAALLKSAEIGKGSSWHAAFERTAYLAISTTLLPQEIAVQAFYERLLLANL